MFRSITISLAIAVALSGGQTFAKGGGGHGGGGHSGGGHSGGGHSSGGHSGGGHAGHVAPRTAAPPRTVSRAPTNHSAAKPASPSVTPVHDRPPHNATPPGNNGGSHQAPPAVTPVHDRPPHNAQPPGTGVSDKNPIAGGGSNPGNNGGRGNGARGPGNNRGNGGAPGNGGSNNPPRGGRPGSPGRGNRPGRPRPERPGRGERPERPDRPGHDHDGHEGRVGDISIGVSVGGGGDAPASDVVLAEDLGLLPVVPAEVVEPAPVNDAAVSAEVKNTAAPAIDLEMVDVRLIDVGSIQSGVGPRLRLYCRNNGTTEAPKFHVSVFTDIGTELTQTAHLVTVESVGIQPGNTQAIDVQLPVEVLKMTGANDKWPKPFDVLAAIADSDDSIRETNKDNNVLEVTRDAIEPLESNDAESAR